LMCICAAVVVLIYVVIHRYVFFLGTDDRIGYVYSVRRYGKGMI